MASPKRPWHKAETLTEAGTGEIWCFPTLSKSQIFWHLQSDHRFQMFYIHFRNKQTKNELNANLKRCELTFTPGVSLSWGIIVRSLGSPMCGSCSSGHIWTPYSPRDHQICQAATTTLSPQRLAAIQETHMAQSRIVAIDAQDSEAPEHGYMGGQPPVGLLMHQNQATGFKVYTICGRTTGPWSMEIYYTRTCVCRSWNITRI